MHKQSSPQVDGWNLYTPSQRIIRDRTVWTKVQGILAPLQFAVCIISLFLVVRYLSTGEGYYVATVSIIIKSFLLFLIMITGAIWEKVVFGQFLFAEDILGNTKGPYPRHSKQYADLYELKQKLQQTRINAFKNYIKDVKDNKFPYKDVTVSANDDVVNALEKYIKK